MSAPISAKVTGSAVGTALGGGVGITLTELLGQLPVLDHANPGVVKALGGLIALLFAVYGGVVGGWVKKESNDFIEYAANESGRVVVAAGKQLGVPQPELATLEQKIDTLAAKLESKAEADAEKLLRRYLPVSTGTVSSSPVPSVSVTRLPDAPPPVVSAPTVDPVLTDAHTTTDTDPVLADDYQPDDRQDPVLAD